MDADLRAWRGAAFDRRQTAGINRATEYGVTQRGVAGGSRERFCA